MKPKPFEPAGMPKPPRPPRMKKPRRRKLIDRYNKQPRESTSFPQDSSMDGCCGY